MCLFVLCLWVRSKIDTPISEVLNMKIIIRFWDHLNKRKTVSIVISHRENLFNDMRYHYCHYPIMIVMHASNELNRSVSLLGSQYTYNVGFGFPTLGDSNLDNYQYFYNHQTAFLSLFVALDLDLRLFFQNFNNPFLSLVSSIYSSKSVRKS